MKKVDEILRGTVANADDNEMLFVLRAQDKTAPRTIMHWLMNNIDTVPEDKAREAFECALAMRQHASRKQPD